MKRIKIAQALLEHPSIKYKAVGAMTRVSGQQVIINELERVLVLTSRGDRNDPFRISLTERVNKNTLNIPRTFASNSGIKIKPSPDCKINKFKTNITLWDKQKPVVDMFLSSLKSDSPYGGIIKAPTGSGKTVMFIKILAQFGFRTLIIVPLDRLMGQCKAELLKYTNLKEKDIGIIRGSLVSIKNKKVVLAMVHSLAQKEYPDYIKNQFGIVLYDEVHVLGAETFSRTAPMFNCVYRFGSSATPRRKDGMAEVFWSHIGEVISEHGRRDVNLKVIMLPYRGLDTNHSGLVWAGKLQIGRYYNRLAKSKQRTEFIARMVDKLYHARGRDTLVLSDRINILKDVYSITTVPEKDKGLFTSKCKQIEKKIILATYGSAGMGVDIPRLTSLILATPRADIEQPVGRLRGIVDGQPMVVDLVDVNSTIMKKWARSRLSFYEKVASEIINKAF